MKTQLIKSIQIIGLAVLLAIGCPFSLFAQNQDSTQTEQKPKDKPIRPAWTASMLIETQNDLVWAPKTLEFIMVHRFGLINADNGFDLAGIYGASNIKLALNYGLFNNFNVGFGTQKQFMIQDVFWKYKILTQTREDRMPISLAYFGNVQMDARDKAVFGADYKFSNRLAFFNQLIISRKFSRSFSLQATLNHAHYNQIDTNQYPTLKHTNFGFGVAGRLKISSTMYILFEYDQALTTPGALKWLKEENPSEYQNEVGLRNLSLGLEIATSSHAFQFFVTTYSGISYQQNLTYNTNYFSEGALLFGFNMTRNWNF